jgi:hypothetical protein
MALVGGCLPKEWKNMVPVNFKPKREMDSFILLWSFESNFLYIAYYPVDF